MQCTLCGKTNAAMCKSCRRVAYCGTDCQTLDWNARHRFVCLGGDDGLAPVSASASALSSSDTTLIAGLNDEQNESKEDIPSPPATEADRNTRVTVTASGYAIEVADRVSISLVAKTESNSAAELPNSLLKRHKARFEQLEYLLAPYTARDVNVRLTEEKDKDYVRVIGRVATSYWTIELGDINKRYDQIKFTTTLLKTAAEYKDFIASVVAAGALVSWVSMYLSRRASAEASKRAIQNAIAMTRSLGADIAETMKGTVERTIRLDVDASRVASSGGGGGRVESSARSLYSSQSRQQQQEPAEIPGQLEEIERVETVTAVFAISEGTAIDRKYKQPKK